MAIFWFESDTKTQGGVWGEAVSASLCGQHGDGQSRISTNASCQVFAPQTMLLHLHLKADDYVTWWPTDEVNSICQPIFDLFQANSNPVGETLHKGVKSTNKSELGDLVPSPLFCTHLFYAWDCSHAKIWGGTRPPSSLFLGPIYAFVRRLPRGEVATPSCPAALVPEPTSPALIQGRRAGPGLEEGPCQCPLFSSPQS